MCVRVLAHSLDKGVGQGLDVLSVQVGGGFIQRQDATVQTERFGQGQADDQGSQHLDTHTHNQHVGY